MSVHLELFELAFASTVLRALLALWRIIFLLLLPPGSACRRTQDPTINVGITESGERAAPRGVKAVKSSRGCSTHRCKTQPFPYQVKRSHTRDS
jgi:hypothetical protein